MKRALPATCKSTNENETTLRKKTSSLLSISIIQEDSEGGNEPKNCLQNTSNSASYSSIGLHFLAHDEPGQVNQSVLAPPKVLFQRSNDSGTTTATVGCSNASLPSVTPLSFTDDENDETVSGVGIAKSKAASLLLKDYVIAPPNHVPSVDNQATHFNRSDTCTTTRALDMKTGLVFETGSNHFDRQNRFHKERPVRIASIRDALQKSSNDVFSRCCIMGEDESSITDSSKFLEDEDYLRVHLPGYMKRLDKLFDCNCCNEERLDREAEQFNSIYFTKDSLNEAKKAAVSLCSLVEKVVRRDLDNGFAVIRPPGHHAEPGLAGGYCIINNIAVAAAYAREKLGVEKILIVDYDVHHGQGTQSIFLKDPNVLYFSAHRFGNFFPFLSNGGPSLTGVGDGEGYNINVGWTTPSMGDDEYLAVWERLLMPIANEYQPDLILVSAGFDAADGDLGNCHVTPECYARLTRSLMTLNTPIVCALEGGYVRTVLGRCVCSVVSALLDRNSPEQSRLEDDESRRERGNVDVLDTINTTAAMNIRATIAAHKAHWKCL